MNEKYYPKDEPEINSGSVVQKWLSDLPWKQQTVVLTALRGSDGAPKNDPSKLFVRKLRATILYTPDKYNSYMDYDFDIEPARHYIADFFRGDIDACPIHWLLHFLFAAEIIGYKCPDVDKSNFWMEFYTAGVSALHLNPESLDQLNKRLK